MNSLDTVFFFHHEPNATRRSVVEGGRRRGTCQEKATEVRSWGTRHQGATSLRHYVSPMVFCPLPVLTELAASALPVSFSETLDTDATEKVVPVVSGV
jgi:hypothetical protein